MQYNSKGGGGRPPITAAAIACLFNAGDYDDKFVPKLLKPTARPDALRMPRMRTPAIGTMPITITRRCSIAKAAEELGKISARSSSRTSSAT